MKACMLGQAAAVLLLSTVGLSSCAAIKATEQPDKRNMDVLNAGVPRTHVIAELGSPVWSDREVGTSVDVFAFKQGYSKGTKAARALAHGAADVATFGLWEVVGIPVESIADGTDVQLEVHYGPAQTVDHVVVIKGDKAVHPPKLFAWNHKRPKADAATTSVAETSPPRGNRHGAVVNTSHSAVR
ncbi:MAG: hypothetical protein DWQ37_07595 [Planctomycetota bacterium]|nr:MAG: hypothetical protein DWQ37_07595 [Planctomycetota bacterium]